MVCISAVEVAVVILCLWLWYYLVVLCHELGHAVVGNALGFGVNRISVGDGPRLIHLKVMGVSVELHPWLSGGMAYATKKPATFFKTKSVAFLSAGFMAEILLIVASGVVFFGFENRLPELAVHAAGIAMIFSIFIFLMSLTPADSLSRGQAVANDMRQIVTILRGEHLVSEKGLQAYLLGLQRYDPNFKASDIRFTKLSTESLQLYMEFAEKGGQDLSRALEIVQRLKDSGELHPVEVVALADGVACSILMNPLPDMLEPAKELVEWAVRVAPVAQTLKGTLGSLLAELGEDDEALRYLHRLTKEGNEDINRAISLLYVTRIYRDRGDREEAQRYWDMYCEQNYLADFPLIQRLEKQLTDGRGVLVF